MKEEPHIDILDFIDSAENSNLLDEMPALPTLTSEEINSVIPSFTTNNDNDILENLFEMKPKIELPIDENEFSEARVLQVKNYQDPNQDDPSQSNIKQEIPSDIDMQEDDDDDGEEEEEEEEIPYEEKYICKKSLFIKKLPPQKYPWEIDLGIEQNKNDDSTGDKSIELIGEYEENEIYKRLKTIFDVSKSRTIDIPLWIRRHYRKLCVRKMQRNLGLPVFNAERFSKMRFQSNTPARAVLDRYHQLISESGDFSSGHKENRTFLSRLAGACLYDLFYSPHTERILHPFIYRNKSSVPPWVKLMSELQYEVNGIMPSRSSIDYCYLRPQHIAAVNGLLQCMFWPGIDSK